MPFVWCNPIFGLLLYFGCNIIRPEIVFWNFSSGSFAFKTYYIVLILVVILKGYICNVKKTYVDSAFLLIWLGIAVILSLYFSPYSDDDKIYYAIEILKIIGICLIMVLIVTNFDDLNRVQVWLVVCFFILGLYGIKQSLAGNDRLERLMGMGWGDSNGIAAIFVLFLPVALSYYYRDNYPKYISLLATFVIFLIVVCTKSRGGFLGLTTSIIAFGYYARNFKMLFKLIMPMILLVSPFITDSYIERLRTMQKAESLDTSALSRFMLWEAGIMIFRDNPIIGSGFLSFPEAKMKYKELFLNDREGDVLYEIVFREENKLVTHNAYIQVFADMGIVGGIPFCLIVFGGIFKGVKLRGMFLKDNLDKNKLSMAAGICAGMTGFAVSVITIDAVLCFFIYIQAVSLSILWNLIIKERSHVVS